MYIIIVYYVRTRYRHGMKMKHDEKIKLLIIYTELAI